MTTPYCPYCNHPAQLVAGDIIYPHRPDLAELSFWQCLPCDAYVGCHKNGDGTNPMGALANAETRALRNQAHALFDPLWKSGDMSRAMAYNLLARELGIPKRETHISWFQADMLRKVIGVLTP